jgi:flagellar hook-length control protein FliK
MSGKDAARRAQASTATRAAKGPAESPSAPAAGAAQGSEARGKDLDPHAVPNVDPGATPASADPSKETTASGTNGRVVSMVGAPGASPFDGAADGSPQGNGDARGRAFMATQIVPAQEAAVDALSTPGQEFQLPSAHEAPAPAPEGAALRVAVPQAMAAFHLTQAAGAEMALPVETPAAALPPETTDSIVQSFRLQYQKGGGDAIVHIKPEHLGPVTVSLRVENGVVSAVVSAENPAVAEWLKSNEHVLRDGLASSGLHLERFAVRRDGRSPDEGQKGYREPEQRDRRRRSLHPASTFEVTV